MTTKCYFDGSCEDNPGGEMGWGWTITDVSQDRGDVAKGPQNSNNVAEYMAAYFLLTEIDSLLDRKAIDGEIIIYGDSKLVINQMNRLWRIKNGMYKVWAQKTAALLAKIRQEHSAKISFQWIRREKNTEADALSRPYQKKERAVSAQWLKDTTKRMVAEGEITLEELVDYVMEVLGAK
jgi:ribonuclease HI